MSLHFPTFVFAGSDIIYEDKNKMKDKAEILKMSKEEGASDKMTEEFNLSYKIVVIPDVMYLKHDDLDKIKFGKEGVPIINLEDIKEFIKLLKEKLDNASIGYFGEVPIFAVKNEIDKLAGEKLC